MESSFCIWLARDNIVWESVELNSPLTNVPESSSSLILKAKIKNNLKNSPTPSKSPVGFINQANICYTNTILQSLSVIPLLYKNCFCGICTTVAIAEVNCTKYGYQEKNQLCLLILQIFYTQSSAKFHLLAVLLLILTPSRMLRNSTSSF